jgi:cytochrome c oxidase subunit III
MSQSHSQADSGKYYIPHGTPWPIIGSVALFTTMFGVVAWLNEWFSPVMFFAGLALLAVMFVGWFRTVINESEAGTYNLAVDRSFRMGMVWFIISEVLFFSAFFGALFYARELSVPWIGGEGVKVFNHIFLWQNYDAAFEVIPAFGVPALNTLILLSSGVTITIAHHALRAGNRTVLKVFLAATFLLGFLFVTLQAREYGEAYMHKGLQLSTGIYGSTFFMLTGFHGLHVTIGAIMLTIIWLRTLRGHFTPARHFGFEAVAWYWHFVDVVWLGLFIFVYWI